MSDNPSPEQATSAEPTVRTPPPNTEPTVGILPAHHWTAQVSRWRDMVLFHSEPSENLGGRV